MADSVADSSVVLLHGPPFVGKPAILKTLLSKSHTSICPESLFKQNPSYGLRDVVLTVVETLKNGTKVIIDSDSATASLRLSYITLIRKKLPKASISIFEIFPKYGCEQLFWSREHSLAFYSSNKLGTVEMRLGDYRILKWFASEEDTEVTYRKGIVEAPKEAEGAKIHKLTLGLLCETLYKFEVPGLLIQWDVLQALVKDGKLQVGVVTKVLKLWSSICACGRIIVICDGMSLRTGSKIYNQAPAEITNVMKQLTESFCDIPIYVLAVHDPGLAGGYVLPPKPGLIAYLQRRHCIDLHSKHTVYLYESQLHMKMAERAGIPHLKASRVLEHPSLITPGHAIIPSVPEMLKSLEVTQADDTNNSGATVPLYNLKDDFRDGFLKHTTAFGRTEYLFAKDVNCIERYQSLYAGKATKVGEPGSKIAEEIKHQSTLHQKLTSQLNTSANISTRTSDSRELPKWMLAREESNTSSRSSLDMSRSDSTSSTDVKVKHTVYVMTEKELTEVAMDILKQAGRTELVEQFLAKRQLEEANKNNCTVTQAKCTNQQNRMSNKKNVKQCNVERREKSHSSSVSTKTKKKSATRENSDSGNFEDDVSSASESWHSEDETHHQHHVGMERDKRIPKETNSTSGYVPNVDNSDNKGSKKSPERLDKMDCHVEDVVHDALDDILTSPKTAKRKTRPKGSPAPNPAKHQQKIVYGVEIPGSSRMTPTKSGKQPDSLKLDSETSRSQRNFNKDILGQSSADLQAVKSNNIKDRRIELEKSRRQTPDLTVLDELFG